MFFTQAVWWAMLLAAIVVFSAAAYLAFLNWNENLAATTVSVFLGAAVAFFIAVLAGLKASSHSDRFVSAVVLDAQGSPVWFRSGGLPAPPDALVGHLSDLRSVAEGQPFPIDESDSSARQRYAARLLQYSLLKKLCLMGPEAGTHVQVSRAITVSLHSPINCRLRDVPPEEVGNLEKNPFAATDREKEILEKAPIRIPAKATLALRDDEVTSIVFRRPGYFMFSVTIRPLGDAEGVLPAGFEYLKDHASRCHSIPLLVECEARFEKYTGGSNYTADVQGWVRAVIDLFRSKAGTQVP